MKESIPHGYWEDVDNPASQAGWFKTGDLAVVTRHPVTTMRQIELNRCVPGVVICQMAPGRPIDQLAGIDDWLVSPSRPEAGTPPRSGY